MLIANKFRSILYLCRIIQSHQDNCESFYRSELSLKSVRRFIFLFLSAKNNRSILQINRPNLYSALSDSALIYFFIHHSTVAACHESLPDLRYLLSSLKFKWRGLGSLWLVFAIVRLVSKTVIAPVLKACMQLRF